MDFEKLLKELQTVLQELFKNKYKDFEKEAKKDIDQFLKESRDKLERWTVLLSNKDITIDDFEWLVKSQKDLLLMKTLHNAGVNKISLGHFKNKIIKTIINTIISVVL